MEPLRAAILASCVCKLLAGKDELRADNEFLTKQSVEFEQLAIDLLDAIGMSDEAAHVLMMVPCSSPPPGQQRHLLWREQLVESATSSAISPNILHRPGPAPQAVGHDLGLLSRAI